MIEPSPEGGTTTRPCSAQEAGQPVLTDADVLELADLAVRIERHYGVPQDTEWAFDEAGSVWMLQSRPVTSSGGAARTRPDRSRRRRAAAPLLRGLGAAPGSASGPVRIITSLADAGRLLDGDVLVTHMTSPDWVPLMRRAAGIVTDSGGMTCHAAIVSRELGVPCVVGTADATRKLRDGELVTVDATHGLVHRGSIVVGCGPRRERDDVRRRRRRRRARSCSSTSPSPPRSIAPRRSTSTASACYGPS